MILQRKYPNTVSDNVRKLLTSDRVSPSVVVLFFDTSALLCFFYFLHIPLGLCVLVALSSFMVPLKEFSKHIKYLPLTRGLNRYVHMLK